MKKTKKSLLTVIVATIMLVAITIYSKPLSITIPSENGGYKLKIIGQDLSINGGKTIHNVRQIAKTTSDHLVILKRNGYVLILSKDTDKEFLIATDVKEINSIKDAKDSE